MCCKLTEHRLIQRLTSKAYYARDPVGRRSLLWALTPEGQLLLTSTGCAESAHLGLAEVSCEAVWCADLNVSACVRCDTGRLLTPTRAV